jgi:gamma-glutamyltranspeptidase / glutathione hydrolase
MSGRSGGSGRSSDQTRVERSTRATGGSAPAVAVREEDVVSETRWFAGGCVASPHHLASAAGQAVLASGGNAVDAAVAANLVLSVVTPYHCGVGGDLLAIVWDGTANGLMSIGAAPSGATPESIRAAVAAGHGDATASLPGTAGMPTFGALPVTVPGAVAGWMALLGRWGSRSFEELAQPAVVLAREGFPVSRHGAAYPERARLRLGDQPNWTATYGSMRAGERFVQPELATTLETLGREGESALYGGAIGERIVTTLQEHGSTMTLDDLAAHRVDEVAPLRGRFRDLEVLELPPPTQGVTALSALGILDALGGPPADPHVATHLRIEAVRAALGDRQDHLADAAAMTVRPDELLAPERLATIAAAIDPRRAAAWPTARPAPGGTAYLCAADRDGLLVSLIQSNFVGFGSGVVVPGTGIGLHDRGAHFSLDPADPNVIAPGKRPMHTLIPAMALRRGAPSLVFGTMGGDGQPQTHVQFLANLLDDGMDVQAAIDAPRFVVDVADGSVALEARASTRLVTSLAERGHDVRTIGPYDHLAGHAHAIEITPVGYAAGSDPRCEGAVLGR